MIQPEAVALHLQAVSQVAGTAKHVAITHALTPIDAVQTHREVVLPGAGIHGDTGQRLGTIELHQEVTGDVVADLQRRDVLALLLNRDRGHSQQNAFGRFQADPVEVPVTHIRAHHQAVDHLVGADIAFAVIHFAVNDLIRRRLAGRSINRRIRIEARNKGQHEASDIKRLPSALFLGNEAFAGKGNARSHGGS
ncbi:hypothetical protein D3C79_608350 [compost metagenome]